jgi:hypothetical protein
MSTGKIYTELATMPSKSNPAKVYTIKTDQHGNLSCNCPSWIFNHRGDRTCKHIDLFLATHKVKV